MRTLTSTILAALALALPASATASPFEVLDGPKIRIAADREACDAQQRSWCAPNLQGAAPLTVKAAAELQTRVLKNFHYVFRADAPWRSFYEGAFDNKPWKAHCGGVTSTMVDALIAAGHPTDKIWRAIVIPATRSANAKAPPVLHMVAIAELDGEFYVLGDTNDLTVYPLSQANFVPTRISQVSEGTVWRSAVRAAPVLVASR